jgi:hypothetical protein
MRHEVKFWITPEMMHGGSDAAHAKIMTEAKRLLLADGATGLDYVTLEEIEHDEGQGKVVVQATAVGLSPTRAERRKRSR